MKKKKVLIVEDEMIIALLIERMVKNLGHEVVNKVSTGEEAVNAAVTENPDIILMDIRLQGEMDGIEAMSKINKNRKIPVIYISGNTDKLYQEKIGNGDYVDFLSKPITITELSQSFKKAS